MWQKGPTLFGMYLLFLEQRVIKSLNVGWKSDSTDQFWDNIVKSIWEEAC